MEFKNYIKTGEDENYSYYYILDSFNYDSHSCFHNKGIGVEFRDEYSLDPHPYVVRKLRVSHENRDKFLAASRELIIMLKIKGYDDYKPACREILRYLKDKLD